VDAWIASALTRVSRLHDEIAPDIVLDGPAWDDVELAEAVVNATYLMRSRQALRDALDSYVFRARAAFERWRAEQPG
jgi:hypothetical protein